ncbi:hypothetical protein [Streptomyces anandii]|uniref:hypothetical protein n=1 Tax=Streptomyces anandii TaxID=285454 RepID=UPI00167BE5EA|nr:hypothetical protein [Streptomyces anandii]
MGGEVVGAHREFATLLGEFRRAVVLVPLGEDEAPLAGDYGGVRWIYASPTRPRSPDADASKAGQAQKITAWSSTTRAFARNVVEGLEE